MTLFLLGLAPGAERYSRERGDHDNQVTLQLKRGGRIHLKPLIRTGKLLSVQSSGERGKASLLHLGRPSPLLKEGNTYTGKKGRSLSKINISSIDNGHSPAFLGRSSNPPTEKKCAERGGRKHSEARGGLGKHRESSRCPEGTIKGEKGGQHSTKREKKSVLVHCFPKSTTTSTTTKKNDSA